MHTKNLTFIRTQGYVLYLLKKGTYNFELEYKGVSNIVYDPNVKTIDQVISMQVIELE